MRWFPMVLLVVATAIGCSNRSDEWKHRYDAELESNTKKMDEVRATVAKKLPNSRPLQQLLNESEKCLVEARKWRSDMEFSSSDRRFHDCIEGINKFIAAGDRALALRPVLSELKVQSAQNARATWHINEASADLDAWDKSTALVVCVTNAEDSIELVRALLESKEHLSGNSTVRMRDTLFFEGDVDAHDGDSELVKAHLRQAFRANTEARAAAQVSNSLGCTYLNELAELELLHVYNLRRGLSDAAITEDRWRTKEVKPAVDLLDRLVKIKQQIAAHCPANTAAAAELKKAEELMAELPRTLGHEERTNFALVKTVIDRAEDELLRYKKDCGKLQRLWK